MIPYLLLVLVSLVVLAWLAGRPHHPANPIGTTEREAR